MKSLFILISIFLLSACQLTPKKISDVSEVKVLLTSITIEAIKKENFVQAQRSISALILSEGPSSWKFIQSALVSLPQEMGLQVLESVLSKQTIKSSPKHLFELTKTYISYKKTDLAIKTINQSIALDDKNLEARFWRARLYTLVKQYPKAEIDYLYILKKAPGNEDYSGQYATFLQETNQFERAQNVLSKQEVTAESLFKRIIFALQNNNTELAKPIYDELKKLEIKQQDFHSFFLKAEAAYWLKIYEDSELYYKKVTGGDDYLDAREMLSLILFDAKRYNETIEILHQLQNAEEKYAVKAYRLESKIYTEQDDIDTAIQTLTMSLQIIPNNSQLLYDRAMLFESINKMKKVEKDLLQIIKNDSENFEALNALGYSLADHDLKLDQAYEYIKQAIVLAPENPAIIDSLGWVQYKLGLYSEAETSFNKAINKDIKDLDLYLHLYHTLLKLNKGDEALRTLAKAKQMFPDDGDKIIKLMQE